jgi:hypothetical protein
LLARRPRGEETQSGHSFALIVQKSLILRHLDVSGERLVSPSVNVPFLHPIFYLHLFRLGSCNVALSMGVLRLGICVSGIYATFLLWAIAHERRESTFSYHPTFFCYYDPQPFDLNFKFEPMEY